MADQSIIDAIVEGFKQVSKLTGGNSAPSTPAAGGAKSGGGADVGVVDRVVGSVDKLGQATGPLVFGFEKLTKGADVAGIALTGMKDVVGKIPGLGGMAAQVVEALAKSRDDLNKAMAESGVGNNDLGKFVKMSGEAGLTTQQFSEFLKTSNKDIAGLGSNAQKSALEFSKVQKTLVEGTAGQELMRAGLSAKELADYTALSMAMSRNRDTSTKRSQEELAKSATDLGREIDATSKMTGQSREQIANQLKTQAESADNMMAMQALDEDQRKNLEEFNASAAKLGPGINAMLQENLVQGAVTSEKGKALMTMYGSAGEELLAAQELAKNAVTGPEKERAKAAMDAATAHMMEFQNSKEFAQNYKSMTAEQRQAVAPVIEQNAAFAANLKKAASEAGNTEAGLAKMKDEAAKAQAGLKDDGTRDEGQELNRKMNEANVRATITMGALAGKVDEANQAFGKSKTAIDAFDKAMDKYVGRANQDMAGRKAETVDKAGKNVGDTVSQLLTGKDSATSAPPAGGTKDAYGRHVKLAEGGIVEAKPEGTPAIIGEGGKSEAVIPLDKLKDTMGSVTTQISSATTPAGGSSVTELDNKQYLEQWKKNYQEQTVIMTGAEQRQAQEDIQRNQERIAEKTAKIKELTDIAATRELTDEEQKELRFAERRKARAEQNLASDQARLSVLQEIDKGGLANQAAMAEKFIEKQAETKQVQEQVVNQVTEGAKEILKVNGKVIDPTSSEAKEVMGKIEEAKDKLAKATGFSMPGMSAPQDVKSSSPGNITGGIGGYDPFHPVIKDQKAADEQKAKIAAQKADLAKKEESKKKAEEQAAAYGGRSTGGVETVKPKSTTEAAETKKADATLKDLNDQLIALNKHMVQLIHHNAEIVDHTKTTARKEPAGQRKGL